MPLNRNQFYKTLAPRLTACISTLNPEKGSNLAPYSFLTPLSFDPLSSGFPSDRERIL